MKSKFRGGAALSFGLLGLLPISTLGHHAFSGVFDMDNLTELGAWAVEPI